MATSPQSSTRTRFQAKSTTFLCPKKTDRSVYNDASNADGLSVSPIGVAQRALGRVGQLQDENVERSLSYTAADGEAYVKKLRSIDINAITTSDSILDHITEPSETTGATKESVFDPACDPEHPRVVRYEQISSAAYKIRDGVVRTPCSRANQLSRMLGVELYFKKEFLQVTGSFKERGACYAMLCLPQEKRGKGVIAASAGNHALALAYHGQRLNVRVTVVMPVVAPLMKIQLCRSYGAIVIIEGATIAESRVTALRMADEQGMTYINGYDHVDILAGQGTIGLEILDDIKDLDAIVVPIGGGGLIAGIAVSVKHLRPEIQIIGVEGENCASWQYASTINKPARAPIKSTIADGLAVATVGVNAFASAHNLIDKLVTVSERYIALSILRLIECEKAVVEGAGATGLAALLEGKLPELKGKRVVVPLCGGNIDTTVLGRCIERGLAVDGRLARFDVVVSDRPGGIAELASILAQAGASVKDMYHERAWLMTDIFSVRVKVVIETRDHDHLEEVQAILRTHYDQLDFHRNELLDGADK